MNLWRLWLFGTFKNINILLHEFKPNVLYIQNQFLFKFLHLKELVGSNYNISFEDLNTEHIFCLLVFAGCLLLFLLLCLWGNVPFSGPASTCHVLVLASRDAQVLWACSLDYCWCTQGSDILHTHSIMGCPRLWNVANENTVTDRVNFSYCLYVRSEMSLISVLSGLGIFIDGPLYDVR